MIFIFIHSLKSIIFLILYAKCARKCLYVLQCAANQNSLRTTALEVNNRKCSAVCGIKVDTLKKRIYSDTIKRKLSLLKLQCEAQSI
jgi:hypothetical protein